MSRPGRWTVFLILLGLVSVEAGSNVMGEDTPASVWIDRLGEADAEGRIEAVRALGRIGQAEEGVVAALERALDDEDRAVRAQTAIALARLGERLDLALPALMEARRDPDERIRSEAQAAWRRIGPGYRAALPYLDTRAGGNAVSRNGMRNDSKFGEELGRGGLSALPAILDSLARDRPNRNSVGVSSEVSITDEALVARAVVLAQISQPAQRKVLVEALGQIGAKAAPALIEALREREPSVRDAAAEALGLIGRDGAKAGAVSALIRALDDPDPPVRLNAVQALSKVGTDSDESMAAVVKALEHKDPVVRRGSAVLLARSLSPGTPRTLAWRLTGTRPRFRETRPLPPGASRGLKKALTDPDSVVRLKVAEALSASDSPDPAALRVLVALLEERDTYLAALAVRQLESVGDRAEPVAPELRETLRMADSSAKIGAALVLGALGEADREQALEALEEIAASDDLFTRLQAAEALVRLDRFGDAAPVLIGLMGSGDPNLSSRAQQVFQKLGPEAAEAVPALIDALEQEDGALRTKVLGILQRLGPSAREAVPAMVRLVGAADPNVRSYALSALDQLPSLPDEVAPDLIKALGRLDDQSQGRAVPLLQKFGPDVEGIVPALSNLLDTGSRGYARQQAIQSLQKLASGGDTEAVDALVGAISHPDVAVRTQAIQALTRMGTVRGPVVTVLAKLIEDGDPGARVLAVQALRNVSPGDFVQAVPALSAVLNDPDPKIADQAAQMLASHGAKAVRSGVQVLLPRIKGDEPDDRVQALERLKMLTRLEPDEIRPARAVLLDLADGPVRPERLPALQLLVHSGRIEGDRMEAILEKALHDDDPATRVEAADGLSILCGPAGTPMPGLAPVLLTLADHDQAGFRLRAFEALGRLGPDIEGVLPRLLAHQDDPEADVRAQVAEGLLRMGHEGREAAVPMIARGLAEASGGWPNRWSRMIGKLRPDEAEALVPSLVQRLDGQSSDLTQTILALQEIGPSAEPAVPALAALLDTASDFDADRILEVLKRIGPDAVEAASKRLLDRLDAPKPEDRVRAVRLLVKLDPRPDGPGERALVPMLSDPSTRVLAASALAGLRRPVLEARPKLSEMLGNPDPSTRVQAARALLLTSPEDVPEARKTLVAMLGDPRSSSSNGPLSRASIARVLAESGEKGMADALPVLVEMLRSSNDNDRREAAQILDRPSAQGAVEAVPGLVAMLGDQWYSAIRAASALSHIGPPGSSALPEIDRLFARNPTDSSLPAALARFGPDGLPYLIGALDYAQGHARSSIVNAIGRLGPSAAPAAPALVRLLLTDQDESETAEARRALLQIGPEAVSALIDALDDDDPAARRRVSEALEEFGRASEPAIPALKAGLDDPDADARIAVASALLAIEPEGVAPLPVLVDGLSEGSPEGRETAALALAKAGSLPEEYAEALEAAVGDGEGLERVHAAEALGRMQGRDEDRTGRAVSVLIRSMSASSLQSASIDALEHIGPDARASIPSLSGFLRSGTVINDMIRAAYAIAVIGRGDGAAVLLGAMDDDEVDPRYRPLFVSTIAGTGAGSTGVLLGLVGHDDPAVRSMAVRHLGMKARGGADVIGVIIEALDDPSVEVQIASVQALGHLDERAKAVESRLSGLLQASDPTLRDEAAIALTRIEGRVSDASKRVLTAFAADTSESDRWRTFRALGGAGADATPTLIAGLKAGDYNGLAASESIARIGPEAGAAIPALRSALASRNQAVRARAALALIAVGGSASDARPVLLAALQSPDLDPRVFGKFKPIHLGTYTPLRSFKNETKSPVYLSTIYYPEAVSRFVPVVDLVTLRRDMARALGLMGQDADDALPALSAIADDPSEAEAVRQAADESRKRIESRKNVDD